MTKIEGHRCHKCSKPLAYGGDTLCYDCRRKQVTYYERGWALWVYEEPIITSIYHFKYQNKRVYAEFYAKELARHYGPMLKAVGIDVLIPIPLHRKRLKERGFNQAAELARYLSKETNIPVEENLLIRKKATQPQKQLDNKKRAKNLNHAFVLNECKNTFKNILLIDDIYTTGSTINACAKVIKETLNVDIYFLCLCVGRGF